MFPISNMPEQLQDALGASGSPIDLLLTDREAAALLRVGVSTFHRWVAKGLVNKPLKLGGTSRWPQSEILAVIEAAKAKRQAS